MPKRSQFDANTDFYKIMFTTDTIL